MVISTAVMPVTVTEDDGDDHSDGGGADGDSDVGDDSGDDGDANIGLSL